MAGWEALSRELGINKLDEALKRARDDNSSPAKLAFDVAAEHVARALGPLIGLPVVTEQERTLSTVAEAA